MRKSNVFPRHSSYDLPNAVGGDGCYIIDEKGKRYLDASGGAAVSCLGHSDKTIQKAIIEQTEKLAFAHTSFFTSEPAELLANLLAKHSPEGLDKVYFVSSGSEAVESSLKLARQYFVEIGKPKKHKVISRRQSYHGNTLGALAAGGNVWRRSFFEKLLVETSLISPCYPYRHQTQDETELEYGLRVANELEEEIPEIVGTQVDIPLEIKETDRWVFYWAARSRNYHKTEYQAPAKAYGNFDNCGISKVDNEGNIVFKFNTRVIFCFPIYRQKFPELNLKPQMINLLSLLQERRVANTSAKQTSKNQQQ